MAYTSGRLLAGQTTGLGSTAVPVSTAAASHAIREVIIQADEDNAENVLVGSSAGQYVKITPGNAITVPVISLSLIYVKMQAGSGGVINWFARD